jgi:hypothetical protein
VRASSEAVVRGDLGNLASIIILQLVDVLAHHLALIGPNCCQKEEILQVLVVAERWWLYNDLLQMFNEGCVDGIGTWMDETALGSSGVGSLMGEEIASDSTGR